MTGSVVTSSDRLDDRDGFNRLDDGVQDLRRLEQLMTYVRWFAAACGAGVLALGTRGATASDAGSWVMVVTLLVGSLVIWGLTGRARAEVHLRRIGVAAFLFDAAVAVAFTWLFAFGEPGTIWAVLFVLSIEGALRYRLRGATIGALMVAAAMAIQQVRLSSETGGEFDITTYVFVVAFGSVIALVTGAMAESWHERSLAAVAQSRQLEEFDQMKDQFLAVTSHEIRGPVTAIIAGIDTVRRKGDRLTPEQNAKLLEMVAQQGVQLSRLVDDLLVTSQLQTGKLALHDDWVELEDTIQHALEGAAGKRRAHKLEVFIDPVRCEIDAARVGQIVRNLVENAYKYTPEDTSVTVKGKLINRGVTIEVADTGEGIPEEKRGQLFEAFSRIEETSAGREGVGLGLYVVSHLTAAMGGRIDLASSSRGTTFTINIPCAAQLSDRPRLEIIRGEGAAL